MTGLKFVLILISLLTFVAGQLLFKRAMDRSHTHAFGRKFAKWLVAGVASMTISFASVPSTLTASAMNWLSGMACSAS